MIPVNPVNWTLLTGADDLPETSRFVWDSACGVYRLKLSHQVSWPEGEAAACRAALAASGPQVFDDFGQLGRISADGQRIEYNAGGGWKPLQDGNLQEVMAPVGSFTSLSLGGESRLAAGYSDAEANEHGVLLFHLAQRWWQALALDFAPRACVVDNENRVWIAGSQTLALCQGEPLPLPYTPQEGRFEPRVINPTPLRERQRLAIDPAWQAMAACTDDNWLYLLVHDAEDQQAILRCRLDEGLLAGLEAYPLDNSLPFATDLAALPGGLLGLMTLMRPAEREQGRRDCPVLRLLAAEGDTPPMAVAQELSYPMFNQRAPRFVPTLDGRVRYQASDGPRELTMLAQARYPTSARVTIRKPIDSGSPDTVWHRLYLDAAIPKGCRIVVFAGVYNDPSQKGVVQFHRQPEPLWNPLPSELPYSTNPAGHEPRRKGLFELLLQRVDGNVRQLRGRYLALRIVMQGDGRHSPTVHNIRIQYPRFCYQQQYLPELYQQEEQHQSGSVHANGADVRERFLACFEGMLSPIEARIANAEVQLYPDGARPDQLPLLGRLLGASLPPHWPVQRQRNYISRLGELQRWRGTLRGIQLMLDIVTDGDLGCGRVVVVENFRLRRTMSTLLGIDMDDRDHPLTLGTAQSGNSIVGESLILSDEDARTFLSLFDPELARQDEQAAVKAFFDKYSHRTTVLLHGSARSKHALVQETLLAHMPAHLQWEIYETDHPFVLGLAPLLTIDTFIEQEPPPRPVTLDDTWLGFEGLLNNPAALSPEDVNSLRGT